MFAFIRKFILILVVFGAGFALGGFLFSKTQPRTFLKITNCQMHCLNTTEFLGLLASAGIQRLDDQLPEKAMETEKTVVIKHPFAVTPVHYVILPKKDIKNISEVTAEDEEYIMDAIAVMQELVKKEGIENYKVVTNGPGYQSVSYLHFHLTGKK